MSTAVNTMDPNQSPDALRGAAGVRRVGRGPLLIIVVVLVGFIGIMAAVIIGRAQKQRDQDAPRTDAPQTSAIVAKSITAGYTTGVVPALGEASTSARPLELPAQSTAASGPARLAIPTNGGMVPVALPPRPAAASASAIGIVKVEPSEFPPSPPGRNPLTPPFYPQPTNQNTRDAPFPRQRVGPEATEADARKAKSSIAFGGGAGGVGAALFGGVAGLPDPITREGMLAGLATLRQQVSTVTKDDPTAAFQARLAQVQSAISAGGLGAVSPGGTNAPKSAPTPNSQLPGTAQASGDRWRLDATIEAPRSAYELRAGSVIPALLISGINSELPGQIVAQISQDVYDTPTGRSLLFPQGARLVGQYSSNVVFGQARVLVGWQRIIYPDGKVLDIGAMPGGDAAGYSGLSDEVNNHYTRVYASALMLSAITAGIQLSQPNQTGTTAQTSRGTISEALGQQLGQVTAQLLNKNMNAAPTLEIRPGYRFNVLVSKDITLSGPYKAFDY